jgi:uncharacterized protein (DUF58 family)
MALRPTPLGWITGAEGAALCLLTAWQQVPLAAAGGVALLGALGAARLLAPRGVQGIAVRWLLPRAIHAGAETTLAVALSAERRVPPLTVQAWDPRAREFRQVARLAGGGPLDAGVRWAARFPARGLAVVPPPRLLCRQPLGLIECELPVGTAAELTVLPALGRVRAGLRARLAEWFAGVAVSPEAGADDLGRLRAFAPGDPPARIHWRASARHRQLLVAERHAPASRRLAIAIDPAAGGMVFERLVSAAATLADDLGRRGWELALHHGHDPRGVAGSSARLLDALAGVKPGGAPLEELVPRGTPCLALVGDDTPQPRGQPAPLVVRDGDLPRLIHLPRRLGRGA